MNPAEEAAEALDLMNSNLIADWSRVLAERVIEQGWIAFADGRIAEFGEGRAPAGAEDARGDLVMPGLIDAQPTFFCSSPY